MFTKFPCEEIIDDKYIKIITSPKITNAVYEYRINNHKEAKVPILYFDNFSNKYSLVTNTYILWSIIRVYDFIKEQVFYFIATKDQTKCSGIDDEYYDKDIIDFIFGASLNNPNYIITNHISNHVVINDNNELIFFINLDIPISREYMMQRKYRTEVGFLDCISLLSNYKEELNTVDQEG